MYNVRGTLGGCAVVPPSMKGYMACLTEKKFDEAIRTLENLGEFESGSLMTSEGTHTTAKNYIAAAYYQKGKALVAAGGDYAEILDCFKKAGDYSDAQEQIQAENDRHNAVIYADALKELEKGNYLTAIDIFNGIDSYSDATEKIKESYYLYGISLLNDNKTDEARKAFEKAGNYPGAADQIAVIQEVETDEAYNAAVKSYEDGEYELAKNVFSSLGGYKDADNYVKRCEIGLIKLDFDETCTYTIHPSPYEDIICRLEPYLDFVEAKELRKEIAYKIAHLYIMQGKTEETYQ